MKRLLLTIGATLALAAAAMPTREEQKAAATIVGELMSPLVADFRAKKKTAVEVGDTAMAYAKEANTEAAKFLLLKGAIWYFAQAKEDAKAVAAIAALGEQVKDLPPDILRNDVIKPAIDHVSEQNVPGLFAQFRSASAQMEIAKLASSIKRNRADEPTRRRYAELLVITGDWKAALDIFAKLDDAKTAKAAKDEIGGKALATAGDFWWGYMPTEDSAADAIKAHAVALYRKAIASGELTGLKKVVAEKRIASVPFADRFNVSDAANVSAAPRGGSAPTAPSAKNSNALYCVIDLSAGPTASKYPVKWLDTPPPGGFNTDEYKTTKLVLRRIEPGTFKMLGKYDVTLTRPFYCGVFEVTQKQYELVMGENPSAFKGDMRPVEKVAWNAIRGDSATYNWPSSVNVDSSTLMGKIQARTGLNFDLPTEAQWEYACRAGTTSLYNNGGDSKDDRQRLARFYFNQEACVDQNPNADHLALHKPDGKGGCLRGHTVVGSYLPNAWGLYDMHGNVAEFCLDWFADLRSGVTDPGGASSGTKRTLRGGGWVSVASCTSTARSGHDPSVAFSAYGFRLCMNPDGPVGASALGSGTPAASGSTSFGKATGQMPKPLSLDLGDGVKMEMVGCPAGKFVMTGTHMAGSYMEGFPNNGVHTVELTRPFWIGKYPVTIEQWERLMSKVEPLPGVKPKDMDPKVPVQLLNNIAMGGLSRKTLEKFMAELTRKFKRQLPPGYIFRLPTEAEWEYALKANSSDPDDPFVNQHPPKEKVFESFVMYIDSQHYWLDARGCGKKLFSYKVGQAPYIPVGQRKPNAWGIYDMGGCAMECFLDSYVTYDNRTEGNDLRMAVMKKHRQLYVDNVKDPLLFDAGDPSESSQKRTILLRYGFSVEKTLSWHKGPTSDHGRWGMSYRLPRPDEGLAVKIRLVAGPDLLKERGITPPPPDSE